MLMNLEYPTIDIASLIDHTLLNSIATSEQVEQWCAQADKFDFASVCVYPIHVKQVAELLYKKKTKVCTVIGFPSGASTPSTKIYEAQEAVENGANELDVVINLGWLKTGKTSDIHSEISEICQETGQTIKVILETNLLTDTEKKLGAEISMDGGAHFIKTCTGWYGGATITDIKLLKTVVKDSIGIKASGGIRSIQQAFDLVLAGANRLGTSRGVDLICQLNALENV